MVCNICKPLKYTISSVIISSHCTLAFLTMKKTKSTIKNKKLLIEQRCAGQQKLIINVRGPPSGTSNKREHIYNVL